jgi:hypothetical protein
LRFWQPFPAATNKIYNLSDPAKPEFAGTIQESSGDVALASDLLVSANEQATRVAAVGPGAFITGITSTGIEEQTGNTFVTTAPVTVEFLVTDDLRTQIAASNVQVLRNDAVEAVLPDRNGDERGCHMGRGQRYRCECRLLRESTLNTRWRDSDRIAGATGADTDL